MDTDDARAEGLRLAVELLAFHGGRDEFGPPLPDLVIDVAGTFAAFLEGRPHSLRLRPAPFTLSQPAFPGPAVPTRTGENGMSVTMTDAQMVSYACEPEDSRGFATSDTLTWSSDDAGAVLTVTPADDGLSCEFTAVAPGSATISVTDGTLSASDLITVTPGGVASLVITPGAVTDQP